MWADVKGRAANEATCGRGIRRRGEPPEEGESQKDKYPASCGPRSIVLSLGGMEACVLAISPVGQAAA